MDKERRFPLAEHPALMGVLGGRRLSINSGESMGPKVTLLRSFLILDLRFSLVVVSGVVFKSREVLEVLKDRLRLIGVATDSSLSWMEARDDFLELWEELREKDRWGGIGVGTFSLAVAGVAARDKTNA